MNKVILVLALLGFGGCGLDAVSGTKIPPAAADIAGAFDETQTEIGAITEPDAEEILQSDEVVTPGQFGWPCNNNSDCNAGLCLENENGKACTQSCTDNCPSGYRCEENSAAGGDNAFYCFSKFTRLCNPCSQDADCNDGVSTDNRCLNHSSDGNFCGVACVAAADCPDGYACNAGQCVTDTGAACDCNLHAQARKLSTSCFMASSPSSCTGTRACGADGLSACLIQTKPEICNGLDDNCNGETDEGLCDDGNQCTTDTCNTDGSCKHEQLQGTACDDGNQCTGTDKCAAGKCVGGALKLCDDSNPCTDDTCDPAGGCLFTSNKDPCDDGNQCTLKDKCSEKACVGSGAPNCDDKNFCTLDACDPVLGCFHTPYQSGAPLCDDKNNCTMDWCTGGKCGHTPISGCK